MSELKRLLLLGDSIRMSYQPMVADLLRGRAEVVGPADNCQYSAYALESLDRWLAELGRPDVVHWNNGIHDVGHNPSRTPVQFTAEEYVANLRAILAKLRATGAQVIWATMTPVHPRRPFTGQGWSWRNEEIDRYNAAALGVMKAAGVPVNDLHALVAADYDRYLAEDQLHLSDAGIRACAEAVVKAVSAVM